MTHKMALLSAVAFLSSVGSQALAQGNPLRDAYFGEASDAAH